MTDFLNDLIDLLGAGGEEAIFPCIADLAAGGVQPSRFPPPDCPPLRYEVTQYLASWCRETGLPQDVCRSWLTDYAVAILRPISRSTPAAIRHSTKSIVQYVYRSELPFACGREGNRFRARCDAACPAFSRPAPEAMAPGVMTRPLACQPAAPLQPVKRIYREQFENALQLICRELAKGTPAARILTLLHEEGLKTRTGREWRLGTLRLEILKLGPAARCGLAPAGQTDLPDSKPALP
ncbi:MAG: hypothetical protein AB1634_06095 [Thermodesulfobacteriota bacterium]